MTGDKCWQWKENSDGVTQYYFKNIRYIIEKLIPRSWLISLNGSSLPRHCFYLCKQIKLLLLEYQAIVVHTFRENNGVADQVANKDIMKACSLIYTSSGLPKKIKKLAPLDLSSQPRLRIRPQHFYF